MPKNFNTCLLPLRTLILCFFLLGLGACGSHLHHVVEPGETLYSIGWIYGYDYRQIASWNNIRPPYKLKSGQRLKVVPPTGSQTLVQDYSLNQNKSRSGSSAKSSTSSTRQSTPLAKSTSKTKRNKTADKNTTRNTASSQAEVKGWRWPTKKRRILSTFSASDPARQGLGIAGERGNPVYAAANGRVVYAGSGLPLYGRLIIVKHNELFLSAYAHNHKLRVKEGDVVKAGQKIADMGSSGTDRTRLYFEIRRHGKPVDPLRYLPK